MRNRTKRLKYWFNAAIVVGCGLLLVDHTQAQTSIYRINDGTTVGSNLFESGTTRPTLTNNNNGTFTLANGTDSGRGNAVFIESSDLGPTIDRIRGRALRQIEVVTVSGTVASSNLDYAVDGIEFGLNVGTGFRLTPNLLFQIDANGERSGFAPFYGSPRPGIDVDRAQTPGVTEASLNDGYSFVAQYSAGNVVYTVSDIVTTNERGGEPVGATSFKFSLRDAVRQDPTLQGLLDNYTSEYRRIVGGSSAYFSHQKTGTGDTSSTFGNFGVSVTLLGDVNRDDQVTFLDIAPFITLIRTMTFQAEADTNLDGEVDFRDISPFVRILVSGL